jgi:hypothetical protein
MLKLKATAMQNPVLAWISDHKEWCFTVICAMLGGAFAVLKWVWPSAKSLRIEGPSTTQLNNAETATVAIGDGAVVTGGVIAGSNNIQSVVINHGLSTPEIPIRMRKPSTPTGNEIRQKQGEVVKGIPLVMRREVLQKYLSNFRGLSVAWPIRIYGVYPQKQTGALTVDGRYGDEEWGAFVRFEAQGADHPKLNTLEEGHYAFLEGRIVGMDEWVITIEITALALE